MPESKAEVEIQFRNRRLAIDAANIIPTWVFGALFWTGISELVLKRLYPNDFIKLQGAVIGADVVGEMPPGVAMVAAMYNTLYLVEAAGGFWEGLALGFTTLSEDPTTGDVFKFLTFQWGDLLKQFPTDVK